MVQLACERRWPDSYSDLCEKDLPFSQWGTGILGHLGVSGDDLQMPCRCPVDVFSGGAPAGTWQGPGRDLAGHPGSSGDDLQIPLEVKTKTNQTGAL